MAGQTDEIGLRWLKEVFQPYSKRYTTGAKRLLILDAHNSHLTADFVDLCKQNASICLCMHAHASHLLQPLDVGVFGPLKRAYGRLFGGRMIASYNHIDKEDFLSLYPEARVKVFDSDNICIHQHHHHLKLKTLFLLLSKLIGIPVSWIARSAACKKALVRKEAL
jgi:hypothetical protein